MPARAPSPAAVGDAVRAAIVSFEQRLEEIVSGIAKMVHEAVPELAGIQSVEDTRRQGAVIVASFIESVRRGEPPAWTEHQPVALEIVRAFARASAGLRPLARYLHHGHGAVAWYWEGELEALDVAPDVRLAALREADELMFAFTDGLRRAFVQEYARERYRLVGAAEARRAQTVKALLAEAPSDQDAVSRALGYELARRHTAIVLWTAHDDADAADRIEAAADQVARALGASGALLVFQGAASGWAWASTDAAPDDEALRALARAVRRDKVSVAIGDPAHGAAGFRTSHQDAVRAMRVAQLGGRRAGATVLYRDVELGALALDDLERSRRFTQSVLGDLAIDDDEHGRLRATLRVFLDSDRSRQAAADRLGVHPNTIGKRIATCQELLGAAFDERPAELRAALALAASLGESVLV